MSSPGNGINPANFLFLVGLFLIKEGCHRTPDPTVGVAFCNMEAQPLLLYAQSHGGGSLPHLGHLVTTLSAANVHDRVGVGELGERLGDNGLAAPESAWDGARTALHGPENDDR